MDTFPNPPLLGATGLKRKAQDDQDDEMSLFRRVRIKTSIMIPTERSRAQSPVTEYESPDTEGMSRQTPQDQNTPSLLSQSESDGYLYYPSPIFASTKSLQEQLKEKTYIFNNATQKDFDCQWEHTGGQVVQSYVIISRSPETSFSQAITCQ
jgi:hypothetical protein